MRKLIRNLLVTFILLALCTASNCKKPAPHPNRFMGPYYLGEVKEYLYFKPGSYWIHKNTVTWQLDTITTLSIDTSIAHCDNDLPSAHYFATYTNLVFYQWSSLLKTKFTHSLYPPAAYNFGYSIERSYIDKGFPAT